MDVGTMGSRAELLAISIQFGGLWVFRDLLQMNPLFEQDHVFCTFNHPNMGLVLISFAKVDGHILAAYALSKLGPDTFSICYPFSSKLDAFAQTLDLEWQIASMHKEAAACVYEFLCVESVCLHTGENWRESVIEPEYASYIFDTINVFQSSSLTRELYSLGEPNGVREFVVDAIFDIKVDNSWWEDPSNSYWKTVIGSREMFEDSRKKTSSPSPSFASSKDAGTIPAIQKKKSLLIEMMETESTYVERLRHLVNDYALPLRDLAKSSKKLLGLYELNTLFPPCLNKLIQLNSAFLDEFEAIMSDLNFEDIDEKKFEEIDLRLACCFESHFFAFSQHYPRYLEQSNDFGNVLKMASKIPKFVEFHDQVKLNANMNVGLSQLIMEPVQRIPRYSLFLDQIILLTQEGECQHTYVRSVEIIKNIAEMPTVDAEERSRIFAGLQHIIPDLAPNMISNSRNFIDCIDVTREFLKNGQLHLIPYTLILFNDRICLVQRRSKSSIASTILDLRKQNPRNSYSKEKRAQYIGSNMNEAVELTRSMVEENTIFLISKYASSPSFFNEYPILKFRCDFENVRTMDRFYQSFQKALSMNKSQPSCLSFSKLNDFVVFFNNYSRFEYEKESKRSDIVCICTNDANVDKHKFLQDGNIVITFFQQDEDFHLSFDSWLGVSLPTEAVIAKEDLREACLNYLINIKRLLLCPFSNRNFSSLDLYSNLIQHLLSANSSPRKSRLSFGGRPGSPSKISLSLNRFYNQGGLSKSCATLPSQMYNLDHNNISQKSLKFNTHNTSKASAEKTVEHLEAFKGGFKYHTDLKNLLYPLSEKEKIEGDELYDNILKETFNEELLSHYPPNIIYATFQKYLSSFINRKFGVLLSSSFIQQLNTVENLNLSFNSTDAVYHLKKILQDLPESSLKILENIFSIASDLLLRLPLKDQCDFVTKQLAIALAPSMFGSNAVELVYYLAYHSDRIFGTVEELPTPVSPANSNNDKQLDESKFQAIAMKEMPERHPKEILPGQIEREAYEDLRRKYHLTLARLAQMTRLNEDSKKSIPLLYDRFNHDLKLIKQSVQASLIRKQCELDTAKWTLEEYESKLNAKEGCQTNIFI
ncbi:RhoGEF Gef2 [Schizosaccharomyces pombe]|uniref:Rho guanine nucleotide exchange factor gef2 n=1 Tax=Schizosaccharomyces pombe (strain 972 / ATCC 24843) TaxID=284812 RepID=GEF2_SCHPO|nr:RhoGEF Gef2 [Schizosaccharomyces pombe]Q09733.1 RecName: Full=Rho guanine nucleotide exchange factor gef2 [Schizosaccharomyces pombe 972h-]CAA90474.1 RhoGEF Gef2 [Schizosaccharomyces pombe]|eukprot:NP_592928.1 RhoGEF Gef2 [Schizosaccharomyces pombe]